MTGQEKISESNSSRLVESIDVETHNSQREKAVHYMFSEGANSCGKKLSDVLNLVTETERSKNGKSLDVLSTEVVGKVRGRSGEFLSKTLALDECPTFYGIETYIPKHEIVDPNDYFKDIGGSRKDIILLNYFLETEADEALHKNSDSNGLTSEEIKTIKKDTLDVLKNYNEISKSWKAENTGAKSGPGSQQLIRWLMQKNNHFLPGAKGKEQNKLLDRAFSYIDHREDDDYGTRMGRKTVKSLLESQSEPAYFSTVLPDMLLINRENKIVGVIEVKSYTPEEVKTWIAGLKEAEKAENDSGDVNGEGLYIAAKYDRRGSQINILNSKTKEPTGMKFGINFDSIRNFINAANVEAPNSGLSVDTIDPQTAEVIPVPLNYPVIVRFPQDVEDEDIQELGNILDRLKIKDVVIQKLPFSSTDINEGGYAAFINSLMDLPKQERLKMTDTNPQLIEKIRDRQTWGLPKLQEKS